MIPEVSKTMGHKTVKKKLDFKKLCARQMSKMFLVRIQEKPEPASALTIFIRYVEEIGKFLDVVFNWA